MTNDNLPIKPGDLLYAVGPGHNPPDSAADLQIYSTLVKDVRLDSAQRGAFTIELGPDRPVLGFPQWTYQAHEIGSKVHRSRADALRTFTEQARCRYKEADLACMRASRQIQWAVGAAAASMEDASRGNK